MIDPVYFGYGAGVVLLGWVCGMVSRFVFSAISMGRNV